MGVFWLDGASVPDCFRVYVGVFRRLDVGDFSVEAQVRNQRVRSVAGDAVRLRGGLVEGVKGVYAVGCRKFERKAELDAFFDSHVSGVEFAVGGGDHCLECGRSEVPAEFKGVVRIVAHHHAAPVERRVDIGSEVPGIAPVRFPVSEFQVQRVVSQAILVVCPVEVRENLVVFFAVDRIAEVRTEHADHDLRVEVFGLVHAADVCAEPEGFEPVVLIVRDALGLDVSLERKVFRDVRRKSVRRKSEGDHGCQKS